MNWLKPKGESKKDYAMHTFLWTLVASGQADLAISWLEQMPDLEHHYRLPFRSIREAFLLRLSEYEGSETVSAASQKFFGENPPASALLVLSETTNREGRHAEALELARQAHQTNGESMHWHEKLKYCQLLGAVAASNNPKAVSEVLDELVATTSTVWETLKGRLTASEVDSHADLDAGLHIFTGTPGLVRSLASTHPVQMRRLAEMYREFASLSEGHFGKNFEFGADCLLARLGILPYFEPARFVESTRIDQLFEDLAAAGDTESSRKLYAEGHRRWASEDGWLVDAGRSDVLKNVRQFREVMKCLVARESIRFATIEEGMALLDTMKSPDSRRDGYWLLGKTLCASRPVAEVIEWSRQIADPCSRSGALLGVAEYLADVNFPRHDPEIPPPWPMVLPL